MDFELEPKRETAVAVWCSCRFISYDQIKGNTTSVAAQLDLTSIARELLVQGRELRMSFR